MNTLQMRIKELLGQCGLPVSYAYPAAWRTFPCCAWRESGSRAYRQADGREHLTELSYTIDVWADAPGSLREASAMIDEVLDDEGIRRVASHDLYETGSRLYHRVMRYRAVVDAEGNIYQ